MQYLDFDLHIAKEVGNEPGAPYFVARVHNSPAGQASTTFALPFSEADIENLGLRVGRFPQGARRLDTPQMKVVKEFGHRLFDLAFGGAVRSCLESSFAHAENQNAGVRIRLRMNDAPELSNHPWEYLFDTAQHKFFGMSRDTAIVRYIELPKRVRPFPVELPLRILVMISSPLDKPALDVEAEWKKLNGALAELIEAGMVELTRLEHASLECMIKAMRISQYHVFHFIGHGGYSKEFDEGQLLLASSTGIGRAVGGNKLGMSLRSHESLKLVVLNACESARNSPSDLFSGAAQSLVQQGIPAVIAMRFEISDEAAITFADEFYSAVAEGSAIDVSLAAAREIIFARGNDASSTINDAEWGTPVLFMRTHDGHLFDIKEKVNRLERAARIAARKREAEEAEQLRLAAMREQESYAAEQARIVEAKEREDKETERKRLEALRKRQKVAASQARLAELKKRKDEEEQERQRLETLRKQEELAAQQAREAETQKRKDEEAEQQRLEALRKQQELAAEQARLAEIQKNKYTDAEKKRLAALREQEELAAERARQAIQKRKDDDAEKKRLAALREQQERATELERVAEDKKREDDDAETKRSDAVRKQEELAAEQRRQADRQELKDKADEEQRLTVQHEKEIAELRKKRTRLRLLVGACVVILIGILAIQDGKKRAEKGEYVVTPVEAVPSAADAVSAAEAAVAAAVEAAKEAAATPRTDAVKAIDLLNKAIEESK